MEEKDLTPKQLQREQRQHEAYELRLEGLSYPQIAAKMGIGLGSAHRYVSAYQSLLAEENKETALHKQVLESARLDKIYSEMRELIGQCHDEFDDNGARLLRDGVKSKAMLYDKLIKVIQLRASINGVMALKAPEVRESSELMDMDVSELSVEDILWKMNDATREE